MKNLFLVPFLLMTLWSQAQDQMAIWTFSSVSGASSNQQLATTEQLSGTPSIMQYYQDIDDNGKGGTGYTDVLAVNHGASSAIAWDDIKGSGADAELWIEFSTEGWANLAMRFDYRSQSADGVDIDFSADGGASWTLLYFQTSLTDGYGWESKSLDFSAFTGMTDQSNIILRFSKLDETGNDEFVVDNLEITGTQIVEIPGNPYVYFDSLRTTNYINMPVSTAGALNGVINDPTDPANTKGVYFWLKDSDTPTNTLNFYVTSSNPAVVNLSGIDVSNYNDSVKKILITPIGVGYSDITVTADDGANFSSYLIKYAASVQAYDPVNTEFHAGVADASTSIDVGNNYIVVANDETNSLLLCHKDSSGVIQKPFNMGAPMGLVTEGDFEASFRKDNKAYWIGSLGNSKSGNLRPDREMIFSTNITGTGINTNVSYEGSYALRSDVINWGDANGYDFTSSAADGMIPKQIDGFNVEGMTLSPDESSIYIGFRAPLVPATGPNARTKALICPLENYEAWFNNGSPIGAPTFGAPIELDLAGRSIRSIERNDDGEYLIVAGDYDHGNVTFALYEWTGNPSDSPLLLTADLTELNPEGIVNMPSPLVNGSFVELLSDDGTHDWYNDATEAKALPEANWKKFRTQTIQTFGATPSCTPTASTTTISGCDSYTWTDMVTYSTSGNYTQTLVNAGGCDSVATLELTLNTYTSGTDVLSACGSHTWIDGNTYNSSNNTAMHTLVGAAANGCDSIVTLNLTINPAAYGTDVLTACGSYTWIDGNIYNSSNNTAMHTLTGAAANGCDSIVTLNLTINAFPIIAVTQAGSLLTADQVGAQYQWLDCDNNNAMIASATNQSFEPTATVGNYAVELTLNGCQDTSSCYLVDYTGIVDIASHKLMLYPNPAKNTITIDGVDLLNDITRLEITSANGQLVWMTEEVVPSIDIALFSPGVYIFHAQHLNGSEYIRFVKE